MVNSRFCIFWKKKSVGWNLNCEYLYSYLCIDFICKMTANKEKYYTIGLMILHTNN